MTEDRVSVERVRLLKVSSDRDSGLEAWQVTDEDGRPRLYFRRDDALLAVQQARERQAKRALQCGLRERQAVNV